MQIFNVCKAFIRHYYKFGIFVLAVIVTTFTITYLNKHELLLKEAEVRYRLQHEEEIRNKEAIAQKTKIVMRMYGADSLEVYEELMKTFDPVLMACICGQESGFNPTAISSAGAKGIAQVMDYHFKNGEDWRDISTNIRVAEKLIKEYLDYFNGDKMLALAAYNSGFNRVKNKNGIPSIKETQNYVAKIMATLDKVNLQIP